MDDSRNAPKGLNAVCVSSAVKFALVLAALALAAAPCAAIATHADFAAANEAYLTCLRVEARSIYTDKLPVSRLATMLAARCAQSYETLRALGAGEPDRKVLPNYMMALFSMVWQQCLELNKARDTGEHEARPMPCKIGFQGVERFPPD